MIEVEIKSKIINPKEIELKIISIGAEYTKKEEQQDIIFGNPIFLDKNKMIIEGGIIARIRITGKKNTLEFKEISRKTGGFEIKSELDQIKPAKELLNKLGFQESFTVTKTRKIYEYKEFTICVDEVKEIGNYIEIEKMINDENKKEQAIEECIKVLKDIDKNLVIETKKYGDMIQEKINSKK